MWKIFIRYLLQNNKPHRVKYQAISFVSPGQTFYLDHLLIQESAHIQDNSNGDFCFQGKFQGPQITEGHII